MNIADRAWSLLRCRENKCQRTFNQRKLNIRTGEELIRNSGLGDVGSWCVGIGHSGARRKAQVVGVVGAKARDAVMKLCDARDM